MQTNFESQHAPQVLKLRQDINARARKLEREKPTRFNKQVRAADFRELDALRNQLTDIAVQYVAQIEADEAVLRLDLAQALAERYRKSFPDTLWRLGERVKSGDTQADATLGTLYRLGIVAERDDARACRHYRAAAEHGHVAALWHAAGCPGAPKAKYVEAAARGGHPAAQEMLGRACLREKRDAACALDWLAKAGEQLRPGALGLLGYMHAAGDLVPKDEKRAFTFILAAAKLGDPPAQNNVGQMYELGRGTGRDGKEAFGWYKKAAEAGFGPAQVNLARCFIEGRGTEKNQETARLWLAQADQQGVKEAKVLLDWLGQQAGPPQK